MRHRRDAARTTAASTAAVRRPRPVPLVALLPLVALVVGLAAACSTTTATGTSGGGSPGTSAPVTATDPPAGSTPAAAEGDCLGSGATRSTDLAYAEVDGVDPNLLSLDLAVPTVPAGCGPTPLVVYVHGGGFRTGDKANRIEDKVDLFTGQGWAFASVNYRLSSADPAGAEVRYPMHERDVATAIAWLTEHADSYDIDPGRILLVGHSSGAYLVSLLSTDTSLLADAGVDPAHVRCTASLDTEYDAAAQVAQGGSQEALYRNALGDDPAVWAAASPLRHVDDPGPHPSFLIVTQGAPRRTAGAAAFGDALVAAGTDATVLDVSPLDHEGINAAVGAPGDTVVTPPLLAFARTCLAP